MVSGYFSFIVSICSVKFFRRPPRASWVMSRDWICTMSGAEPERVARMSWAFTSSRRITSNSTLIPGFSCMNVWNWSSGMKSWRPNQTLRLRSCAAASLKEPTMAVAPNKTAADRKNSFALRPGRMNPPSPFGRYA